MRGLARHTLRILKEEEPLRLSANVPCWKNVQVQAWVQQVGFANLADRFQVSILSLLFLKWSECSLKKKYTVYTFEQKITT